MKKLSLLIVFLIIASCNAPVENSDKKAGYLKAGDTNDLSLEIILQLKFGINTLTLTTIKI